MHRGFLNFLVAVALLASLPALGQSTPPQEPPKQDAPQNGGDFSNVNPSQPLVVVPKNEIIIKGASASASDSTTPVPEGGGVSGNVFSNKYFGITYTLPPDWYEKLKGPPPSDSGRYVLAQLRPSPAFKGPNKGTVLITADDMFFSNLPAKNALEVVNYTRDHLQADYKMELKPTEVSIGGRPFAFFAYWSPVAEVHWYVLATQIRCHTLQIVLSSRDTKLLEGMVRELDKMKFAVEADPAAGSGGGAISVCLKDYAQPKNLIARVEPVLTEHQFNPVPVRIIIDKEGKVKHIHFISAFADQSEAITQALQQWRFKPYLKDGKPTEVETGIMFGRDQLPVTPTAKVQTAD
ncbi:MAG TPA: energy transducer TonB [Candidatus Angelobacter sp.]|jgi:hypothetical protein|nr:energy transducer TonB [Candidatus Angelobacter sp.]